jgi:putative transposase
VRLLARTHQQVQRQRCDFHHTTALSLLRTDDPIAREDVRVATMVRNQPLATRSSDASWAALRTLLDATAACAGRQAVAVPPASTSQDCQDGSGCGERVRTSLSVRTHVCPCCGLVLDRDEHAAANMLRAGQAPQARTQRVAADVA